MYSDIKPRVKKRKNDSEELWCIFYESPEGEVYEFSHKNFSIALKTWHKMFGEKLNIKPIGGG